MTASIIEISLGLLIIFLFVIFKRFDKKLIYSLVLTGIGFLYVGFVWTGLDDLVIYSIQAVLFLFIAYSGVQRNIYLLAGGFFPARLLGHHVYFLERPRVNSVTL